MHLNTQLLSVSPFSSMPLYALCTLLVPGMLLPAWKTLTHPLKPNSNSLSSLALIQDLLLSLCPSATTLQQVPSLFPSGSLSLRTVHPASAGTMSFYFCALGA